MLHDVVKEIQETKNLATACNQKEGNLLWDRHSRGSLSLHKHGRQEEADQWHLLDELQVHLVYPSLIGTFVLTVCAWRRIPVSRQTCISGCWHIKLIKPQCIFGLSKGVVYRCPKTWSVPLFFGGQ